MRVLVSDRLCVAEHGCSWGNKQHGFGCGLENEKHRYQFSRDSLSSLALTGDLVDKEPFATVEDFYERKVRFTRFIVDRFIPLFVQSNTRKKIRHRLLLRNILVIRTLQFHFLEERHRWDITRTLPSWTYFDVRFNDLQRVADRFHEKHSKAMGLCTVLVDKLASFARNVRCIEDDHFASISKVCTGIFQCFPCTLTGRIQTNSDDEPNSEHGLLENSKRFGIVRIEEVLVRVDFDGTTVFTDIED